MRQIGILEVEKNAHQFADYLVTQGITAHAEEEKDSWVIWVRDEDHLELAQDEFENFRRSPDDPRYSGVATKAKSIRDAEFRKRDQAHRNTIEMRTRWKTGAASARRCPTVFMLIGVCVLVALLTGNNFDRTNYYFRLLQFKDPVSADAAASTESADNLRDIRRGEVWRIVTPVLVHGSALHLIFNMYWLYFLGGQFEHLRGSLRFLLFILGAAIISVQAQGILDSPFGGGMSGVNYAIFGFVWMRWQHAPEEGFQLGRLTILFMIAWFFYCFFQSETIANAAHAFGFGFGIVLGYLPVLFKNR